MLMVLSEQLGKTVLFACCLLNRTKDKEGPYAFFLLWVKCLLSQRIPFNWLKVLHELLSYPTYTVAQHCNDALVNELCIFFHLSEDCINCSHLLA